MFTFFFQAEDGIRDIGVTGVQTCALPILPSLEEKAAASGDQMDLIAVQNTKDSLELLKQRVYDLEMAKMVSIQTAPQIRILQKGNYKLVSKIHSAFVVTIPVFKKDRKSTRLNSSH